MGNILGTFKLPYYDRKETAYKPIEHKRRIWTQSLHPMQTRSRTRALIAALQ
jgi:hypothetical protein